MNAPDEAVRALAWHISERDNVPMSEALTRIGASLPAVGAAMAEAGRRIAEAVEACAPSLRALAVELERIHREHPELLKLDRIECACGDPLTAGVVHRTSGPCYLDGPEGLLT